MNWFKIKVDATGAIVSCEQVDEALKNRIRTFYVQAKNENSAINWAKNRFKRIRDTEVSKHREKNGLCTRCGDKPAIRGEKKCRDCKATYNQHRQGYRAERAANDPTYTPRPNLTNDHKRLDILLEVQKAWVEAPNNGVFTRWLNARLAELGEEKKSTLRVG